MPALRYSPRMIATRPWLGYLLAVAATLAVTLGGLAVVPRVDVVNVAMVYVFVVLLIALRFGQGPTIVTSILAVAAFDVVFVPPHGRFSVDDLQYLLTFAIMAAIGLVVSRMRERIRRQEIARAELSAVTETEKMRSTLLASISHDLRTPLAVLSGASSTLAEQGEHMSASERTELARSLYRQSTELSDWVVKLLQMTRLESGAIAGQPDWTEFGEIANAVVNRTQEQFPHHHLIVETPSDLPLIKVDAVLMEQALANLVDNAVRHTPNGTVVRIRVARHDTGLLVSVEDNGHSSRDAALDQAFITFGTDAVGARDTVKGLGLSITRAIVRLHHGRSWGEILPEGRVAFRFSLPLGTPPVPPVDPEE